MSTVMRNTSAWSTAEKRAILNLPNELCVARLLIVAVLWFPALFGPHWLLAPGIVMAGLTDVADGMIARRAGITSRLGSQLDSIADLALMSSTFIWLVLLRPDFFLHYWGVLILWVGISITSAIVGWVRFRRIADLHLYSAKSAAVVSYAFAVWLLVGGNYRGIVAYIAIGASLLAAVEALLLVSTRSHVDEHIGSILRPAHHNQ
jgi:phosphatidylglycerophosphate synthase